jgi:hypothetical protein
MDLLGWGLLLPRFAPFLPIVGNNASNDTLPLWITACGTVGAAIAGLAALWFFAGQLRELHVQRVDELRKYEVDRRQAEEERHRALWPRYSLRDLAVSSSSGEKLRVTGTLHVVGRFDVYHVNVSAKGQGLCDDRIELLTTYVDGTRDGLFPVEISSSVRSPLIDILVAFTDELGRRTVWTQTVRLDGRSVTLSGPPTFEDFNSALECQP